jgi:inner membrane protein involved in colicin E2 resistance
MSTIARIFAIAFIFVSTTIAWMVLGATISQRTYNSDDGLRSKVASSWGAAQVQGPPSASYTRITEVRHEAEEGGKIRKWTETSKDVIPVPLDSTRATAQLQLEHRQKGLLWYSTYKIAFDGTYGFHNPTDADEDITFVFPLPAAQAIYDNMSFTLDGVPLAFTNQNNSAQATAKVSAGKTATLHLGYASQGMDRWSYSFGPEVAHVRDFHLTMTTNFKDIDFPENTLSPSEKHETADGWQLVWNYKDLLSGYQIGMAMPDKLQPGPLAGRISFFAPVSLFFFFFLVFIITTIRGVHLHPMNYFFLAAAFFAFHLLMAYMVDHFSIHWSFFVSAIVSLFLVITYMRLVAGARFALIECGLAQLVYLVLFSYAFFFKGYTGLAITIGAIATLFAVMQMTGRINWTEKFARPTEAATPLPQQRI